MIESMALFTIVMLTLVARVTAYSDIPPPGACNTMTPSHSSSPQTGINPYQILSKNTYSTSEQIQVTLEGLAPTTQFRGFMVQARSATDPSAYTTYGTFATLTNVGNPCNQAAATHSDRNGKVDKTSVSLTWTAPNSNVGSIVFVYTVVQTQPTYWVRQLSSNLTYQAPTTAAPTTAAPTNAAPTTAAPTSAAPTTAAPTTAAPTTAASTTTAPTTAAPTNAAPTTAAPITAAPTTARPSNAAPSTSAPTTTVFLIVFIFILRIQFDGVRLKSF